MSLSREKIKDCIDRIEGYDKLHSLKKRNSVLEEIVDQNVNFSFAEGSQRNIIHDHTEKINDYKKEAKEYLQKVKKQADEYLQKVKENNKKQKTAFKSVISTEMRVIDAAKKKLAKTIELKKSTIARVKNGKKELIRNTRKIDQIKKRVTKCINQKHKNARCPNGTHKNRKSGTCEKK